MSQRKHHIVHEPWRRLGLALLLFGIGGVALELLLLEHFEDPWQWAPIALLTVGFASSGILWIRPGPATIRVHQALMGAYLIVGALGVYLHLRANLEFELELRPSMAGMELVMESLKGAMPALAPAAMVQLGLLGLLVSYRHPARQRLENLPLKNLEN